MMKIKTEAELCKLFIEAHPRKEHLYFEVHIPRGRADIIHKETSIVTIYEAKMRLGLDVLEQCINRKPYAHFVYAVVPKTKIRSGFLASLFQDYGIGVISLRTETEYIETEKNWKHIPILMEDCKPSMNRHPKKITIYEENKKETAGVQSSGVTPFSLMVSSIKKHLSESRKPVTVDEMFKRQSYYGTLKQFKTNIYQWIRVGVIKGIKMEGGKLTLQTE